MMEPAMNFSASYIERCDKESEKVLAEESISFLEQSISYFNVHKNEFIFVESALFDEIGVDAVCFEVDDVFGTYDVMLGLKLQKKYHASIKGFLQNNVQGNDAKFDLMFDSDDGLWDLNFALNGLEGFREEMTIGEAYTLIYRFLASLVETVKSA